MSQGDQNIKEDLNKTIKLIMWKMFIYSLSIPANQIFNQFISLNRSTCIKDAYKSDLIAGRIWFCLYKPIVWAIVIVIKCWRQDEWILIATFANKRLEFISNRDNNRIIPRQFWWSQLIKSNACTDMSSLYAR